MSTVPPLVAGAWGGSRRGGADRPDPLSDDVEPERPASTALEAGCGAEESEAAGFDAAGAG